MTKYILHHKNNYWSSAPKFLAAKRNTLLIRMFQFINRFHDFFVPFKMF